VDKLFKFICCGDGMSTDKAEVILDAKLLTDDARVSIFVRVVETVVEIGNCS